MNIVHSLETTLARRPFNTDEIAMYQASALSVRDHLIAKWTDTQTFYTQARVKRVYYFSLEFLLGRYFDNASESSFFLRHCAHLLRKSESRAAIGRLLTLARFP